jgi:hypothetical protein
MAHGEGTEGTGFNTESPEERRTIGEDQPLTTLRTLTSQKSALAVVLA